MYQLVDEPKAMLIDITARVDSECHPCFYGIYAWFCCIVGLSMTIGGFVLFMTLKRFPIIWLIVIATGLCISMCGKLVGDRAARIYRYDRLYELDEEGDGFGWSRPTPPQGFFSGTRPGFGS